MGDLGTADDFAVIFDADGDFSTKDDQVHVFDIQVPEGTRNGPNEMA
ncbi:MAG: hypothetical protein GX349_04215 [Firmicutes bacterium]|nr:hypothetical protein [Bacillota bacterium]